MLSALRVTPSPPTVGTGLARPRWDVLAFGHCSLQGGRECRGRWGLFWGGRKGATGPFVQPELQFRGEGVRMGGPPEATFMCPEHQPPSGHSAARTASVTSVLSESHNILFVFSSSHCHSNVSRCSAECRGQSRYRHTCLQFANERGFTHLHNESFNICLGWFLCSYEIKTKE